MSLARKAVDYGFLEQEVRKSRTMYEALLQQLEQLDVAGAAGARNVRVFDRARVPTRPMSPSRILLLFTITLTLLVVSAGLCLVLEHFDDSDKK